MTPQEWNVALPGKRWQETYPIIEREARAFLELRKAKSTITTSELVEFLYPRKFAEQSDAGLEARAIIFKALLADKNPWRSEYAAQGPKRLTGMNKGSRPWLWGARRAASDPANATCPTCGQEIF